MPIKWPHQTILCVPGATSSIYFLHSWHILTFLHKFSREKMFCLRFWQTLQRLKLIRLWVVFLEAKSFTLLFTLLSNCTFMHIIFPVENVIASLRLPIMMRSSWWAYKNRENACPPGRELIDHTCTFTFWRNFFSSNNPHLSPSPPLYRVFMTFRFYAEKKSRSKPLNRFWSEWL